MTMMEKAIVDAIFADLRDRRFLKWIFSELPTVVLHDIDGEPIPSLDADVQQEIKDAWEQIIVRALSAQGEAAQPAAEGWQMVPKRVTPEMIDAHFKAHAEATSVFAEVQSIWAHMLAAAPASPTTMHGPYGWLIMPEGLNEEHWHLADEPEPGTPSEPLFARRDMLPASPAASQDGGRE